MSLKQNVIYSLNQSRGMLNRLVDSLNSPEDWFYQPFPAANHPLWIVGHLALADQRFAAQISGQQPESKPGWDELFWFGSEIQSDQEKYPPIDEVVNFFHEQRENLMKVIDQTDDDFFTQPPPEGRFSDAPNMGQMLIFASFHEGMHLGQFTVAHRGLGHSPLLQPNPNPTT